MKRTLLFIISLFAVFALVACGSKKQVDIARAILKSAQTLKTTTFESKDLQTPKAPRDMKFAGWYKTSIGQSVFEPKPLQDGDFVQGQKVYPYFIPVNDKTFNWSKGATFYSSSVQAYYQNPLNPFTAKESFYNDMITSTQIQLVRTVPNWRQAVKDGLAKYPFDFSKLNTGQASFNNVQQLYIKDALAKFPMDSTGNEHLNEYGEFDNTKSADYVDTVWTFELKHDLKFAVTNTPIDAHTYEFGIKTALDPTQNNIKGKTFYKDAKNTNGAPILNAKAYYKGDEKDWSKVGFKVDSQDPYKFIITFSEPVSQSSALGFASEIPVVEPAVYNKTLNSDKSKSSYGTDADSYSNSGAYILKEFNNKSKVVFNKNFDYPLSYLFPNKSNQTTLVQDQQAKLTDFVEGNSIAIGLTSENKDKLSKWQSTTKDFLGESARLLIFNLTGSSAKTDKVETDPIVGNTDFRRALLFAINRNDLAANAGFPGQPVAIPVSNDAVQYITSKTSYAKSDFHKAVLSQYGLTASQGGYDLGQAQSLLKKAYAALKYPDTKVIKLVVVRPDDNLWKNTFNEVAQNFKDAFDGKVILVDKPLSGEASDQATKTYNWDLLLTGLSANTYYNILWQFCAINFAGSLVGAASLGINGPVDNYVTDPKLLKVLDEKTQVHYGEYYNQSFDVNLPKTYAYLKSKFEDKHSEYYNVDGSVKENYKKQKEVYDELKKQGGTGKGKLSYEMISNDLVLDDNSVLNAVSNNARFEGAGEEAYSLVQIFDKLFFEYVPSMGLYTNAGKVVYKRSYANMWQSLTLRWERGTSAYRFLTTDPYYVEFADSTLSPDQIAQKVLDANVPQQIKLTLPQGLTATLANQNSATLQGSTITTYVGNTVELTLNTGDASKSVYSLTINGQTVPCVTDKPNSFIFVAEKEGQIQATSETTHYTIKNLPVGVKASVENVEYNQPVTFTLTPPTSTKLYSFIVGGTDYTDQVKDNTLTIEHLTVNPTVQVSFITPITISSEWKPVIDGTLITVDGKQYVQYGVVTAFNRTIPGADSAKEYSITINGQAPTEKQFTTKYEFNETKDENQKVLTESVKDLVLTLILDGNYTQDITVTDLPAKELAKVFAATKEDNFEVQFETETVFPGINIENPTEEFDPSLEGSIQFNAIGSKLSFSLEYEKGNYTLTSVTYNGQTLTPDAKTKLYSITVVAGQEVKVVLAETEAHKQLTTFVNSKFTKDTVITGTEKSLQGIANGVYQLLGDGSQEKYVVSVSLVKKGIVNVTISQKVEEGKDAASVVVSNVPYKFAAAQPAK